MSRPLIYNRNDAAVVKRVIELYDANAMELRSPMLLYPQRRGGDVMRDHYWRRSFGFARATGLPGKYWRHAGSDFSFYAFDKYLSDGGFTPIVFAPCEMKVLRARWGNNGGNHINAFLVTPEVHEDVYAWFFHLGRLLVDEGDRVRAGTPVAEMVRPPRGWGRWARGAHLHFHVSLGGNSTAYGINWELFEDVGNGLMAEERRCWANDVIAHAREYGDGGYPARMFKRWFNLKPPERTRAIKQLGFERG